MILDKIVNRKQEEVEKLKANGIVLPKEFREKHIDSPRGFVKSLIDFSGVSIIAEAKKASPSKGLISPDFDPVKIALNYEKNGAQAVSVLTDEDFFQGSLLYLMQVREAIKLPVIRKDFIIDSLQIEEAHMHGADAILLIAAILTQHQITDFHAQACEYGMDVLLEVHNEQEMEMAIASGIHPKSEIIGVNNRNLNDFSVDINTSFRLQRMLPFGTPLVSESGLKSKEDIQRLRDANVTAALIGESLMRAGAGSNMLQEIRG